MTSRALFDFLDGMPDLRGGNCMPGRSGLDPKAWVGDGSPEDIATAVALCMSCSCLETCRAWLAGLSKSQRPAGVVAGERLLSHERLTVTAGLASAVATAGDPGVRLVRPDGHELERQRDRLRDYYQQHREELLARRAAYYLEHRDEILEYHKRRRQAPGKTTLAG